MSAQKTKIFVKMLWYAQLISLSFVQQGKNNEL